MDIALEKRESKKSGLKRDKKRGFYSCCDVWTNTREKYSRHGRKKSYLKRILRAYPENGALVYNKISN